MNEILTVIDECDDWIVVEKPAPLIIHPANGKIEDNLLERVRDLLMYEVANGREPAVITRLDRETSGLVLLAKHRDAARELCEIFENRKAEKAYMAIVHGWPEEDFWLCDRPILRAGEVEPSRIWLRQTTHPHGKECFTEFYVQKRWDSALGKFSLLRCVPRTGRMHQIRVHAEFSGHPIVGDKLYGKSSEHFLQWIEDREDPHFWQRSILSRQALHACELRLPWKSGKTCWLSIFNDESFVGDEITLITNYE